jgi:hypothetical protein
LPKRAPRDPSREYNDAEGGGRLHLGETDYTGTALKSTDFEARSKNVRTLLD